MTIVVGLLLAALGLLVGSAMAFVFAHYLRWVRRRHPGPFVRGWRILFVFPMLVVLFATIQLAGVSATGAVDIHHRELVFFGYLAGFFGTRIVYRLRRRKGH